MYLTADGRQMARISRPADSVLIIDDELALLEMLQTVISTFGYEVTIAADVDQAERILTRQGTQAFQCVITDYKMPGKTGLELLRWLQNLDRDLSIVVNTGYASHEDVSAMIREGAVDVLRKPVRMDCWAGDRLWREADASAPPPRAGGAGREAGGRGAGLHAPHHGHQPVALCRFLLPPMHQAGGDFVSCYPGPTDRT
jgi:CheY-like chemotaxis protein